jgi:hypothetical protein
MEFIMNNEEIIFYIRRHFPVKTTESIAKNLNLSISQVRRLAKINNITKSSDYLKKLKESLKESRKQWFESNSKILQPSFIQEQLIFGSILGDGYLSTGARRSINCYYQEHFSPDQLEYRKWKLDYLKNLGFSINGNYLRSPSNSYFTKLRNYFYLDNIKKLPLNLLQRCTHPMFLASLYLDDGSLVVSNKYNSKNNMVICHPSIILYTLNLTPNENQMLANHLNSVFGTKFVVSGHPHGNRTLLKINKEKDVTHFLNIIKPVTVEIPSMYYKTCLEKKLLLCKESLIKKYGLEIKVKQSSSNRIKNYSNEEIKILIKQKKAGYTDKHIAEQLGRSYWSIVYKLSELRKLGKL